jgi:hypothetical protein
MFFTKKFPPGSLIPTENVFFINKFPLGNEVKYLQSFFFISKFPPEFKVSYLQKRVLHQLVSARAQSFLLTEKVFSTTNEVKLRPGGVAQWSSKLPLYQKVVGFSPTLV